VAGLDPPDSPNVEQDRPSLPARGEGRSAFWCLIRGTLPPVAPVLQGDVDSAEQAEAVRSDRDDLTAPGATVLFDPFQKYSPDQPRDEKGRWTAGGDYNPTTGTVVTAHGPDPDGTITDTGERLFGTVDQDTVDAVKDTFEGEWGGLRADVTSITGNEGHIHLTGRVVYGPGEYAFTDEEIDAGLEEVGTFERDIYLETREVAHTSLFLNGDVQGRGFAKGFLSQSEAHYRAQGIERVLLDAAGTIGGYAWAKAGFDFVSADLNSPGGYKPGKPPAEVRSALNYVLDDHNTGRRVLPQPVYDQIVDINLRLDRGQHVTAHEIATLGDGAEYSREFHSEYSTEADHPVTVGQYLLLGSQWYGMKDLTKVTKSIHLDDLTDEDWMWIERAMTQGSRVVKYSPSQPRDNRGRWTATGSSTALLSTVTLHAPDGNWTAERQALHDRIVAEALVGHTPSTHRVATFLGGGTAAGKSSLRDRLDGESDPGVIIDPDALKAKIPEFGAMREANDPRAAAIVHEESSYLSKRILKEASDRGLNLVLDGTGDSTIDKLRAKVQEAREDGHLIRAQYVTVSIPEAIRRAGIRAEKIGRHVPESFIREVHASVSDTFAQAVGEGLFDEAQLWDNEGSSPVLVGETSATGHWTVHEPDLWADFLAKGGTVSKALSRGDVANRVLLAVALGRTWEESGLPASAADLFHRMQVEVAEIRGGDGYIGIPWDYNDDMDAERGVLKYAPDQPRDEIGRWTTDMDTFISDSNLERKEDLWADGVNEADEMLRRYEERNLEDFGSEELDEAAYYGYQNWASSFYETDRIQQAAINLWGARGAMTLDRSSGRLTTDRSDDELLDRHANTYGNARALMRAIDNAEPSTTTLHRGMRVHKSDFKYMLGTEDLPRDIKGFIGRKINLGLSAFSPDYHTATSFVDPVNPGERKIMLITRGPVKAYDASPDEWISAGEFEVVDYGIDHARGIHEITITQKATFRAP
jgi:predicted ABC-type ATPase/GNAT superfamily N-acetyltransferase